MKISDIKSIKDDKTWKRALSIIWDIPKYKDALYRYNEEADAEKIMRTIINTYMSIEDNPDKYYNKFTQKDARQNLRRLSTVMYGDKASWAKGTRFEEAEKQNETKIKDAKTRYENLDFIYDKMGIERGHKVDIVYQFAKNEEVYDKIMEANANGTLDAKTLYDIVRDFYCAGINENKFYYAYYAIMCTCSKLHYGAPFNWVRDTGKTLYELRKIANVHPKSKDKDKDKEGTDKATVKKPGGFRLEKVSHESEKTEE